MSVVSFAQDPALGFSIVDELLEPLGLEFRVWAWGLGFRLGAWDLGFGPYDVRLVAYHNGVFLQPALLGLRSFRIRELKIFHILGFKEQPSI